MKYFDYANLNEKQQEELQNIIAKHFDGHKVDLGYDMFDDGLYIRLDNNDYVMSTFNFATLGNVDLAVDYNMFFAKNFGEDYIEFSKHEIEMQMNCLEMNDKKQLQTYNYLKSLKDTLEPKYNRILEENETL